LHCKKANTQHSPHVSYLVQDELLLGAGEALLSVLEALRLLVQLVAVHEVRQHRLLQLRHHDARPEDDRQVRACGACVISVRGLVKMPKQSKARYCMLCQVHTKRHLLAQSLHLPKMPMQPEAGHSPKDWARKAR